MRARLLLRWVLALGVFPFALAGRTFSVVAYNLENLFDADGVAVYDDYQPERYRPAHLRTKLRHTADVLARLGPNAGPDVILFQEVEVDQTPASSRHNYTKLLERYRHTTFEEMLARDPLPPDLADWPAEAWLVKALHDRGMTGYTVAIGTDQAAAQASGQTRAIKCVTFSRFPVRAVRQHPLRDARNIVEVELEVEGARFFVFNNHWKSGAGDPELEQVRLDNARVLRARLDEILADDPTADILVGGDFNGHYNQKQRYPAMARTALNDVLLSQGHELAIRQQVRSLYNLWYELPPSERGSDTYRGEWGTLQQMMISRGLYDRRGVQYEDNSFQVGRIAGLNADLAGAPRRWDAGGSGAGFSDHLPIVARFLAVDEGPAGGWLTLERPSEVKADAEWRRVDYSKVDLRRAAVVLNQLPTQTNLRDGAWSGKIFRVRGEAIVDQRPRVKFAGEEYEVFAPDDATFQGVQAQLASGRFSFYGELGTFKGRWQFIVHDPSWLQ